MRKLGSTGKFVLAALAISTAALQFYGASIPYDTDKKFGAAYQPVGIFMSLIFLAFGIYVSFRNIPRVLGILIYCILAVTALSASIVIRHITGPGA